MMIAIDPGTTESAICIYHSSGSFEAKKWKNEQVLDWLQKKRGMAYPLAIEMVACYGMPVGEEVFETCVWIGRFIQAYEGEVRKVYRKEVKLHLCGSMKAKDANIRQALFDRFGGKGTKKAPGLLYNFSGDMYSALAVALTALETQPKIGQR